MSTKAERRRKQAKAHKQARQAIKQVPENENYVAFGVARVNGQDHIVNLEADDNLKFQKFQELITPKDSVEYMNVFRLYENGRAVGFNLGVKDNNPESATVAEKFNALTSEFKERLESEYYYDRMFPDIAAEMKAFVQKTVTEISKKTTMPVQLPKDAVINPEYLTNIVRDSLETAKKQIMEAGEAQGVIGWGTDSGIVAYPGGGLVQQKYRFGRAISEIASIINAPFVIHNGEGWWRDNEGKRTGDEVFQVQIILPDGSVPAFGHLKFRRIDCPLTFKDLVIEPRESDTPGESKGLRMEQFIFPKWAYIPTLATLAA